MPNASESGYGTSLGYSADGLAYTALAGVASWGDMFGKSYAEYESTRTDQATRMQDFQPAVYDPGTLNLVLGCGKTGIDLIDGFGTTTKYWQITFASGDTAEFQGWVKEWKVAGSDAKGEHKVNLAIRINSAVTLTAAA